MNSMKTNHTWKKIPLRYLFHVLNGGTPSSNEQTYWDGDIFWATPEDIGSLQGKVLHDTRRKITREGYSNSGTQIGPEGSIVLTTRAPVGNLAISDVPICTNQGCRILVSKSKELDVRYFYYQLLINKSELNILATGTTFVELGADDLRSVTLLYPPPSKQHDIANYLECETAHIDALIDAKQRFLGLLAEKRKALIEHAVTHGLNSNVPMLNTGLPWLGEIPNHWELEFARWLFDEIDERSENGDEELLSVSHLSGVTPRSEKDVNMFMAETNEGYKVCQPGDLVINTLWAWMGAMGVAFQHGLVSPAYNVYRPTGQYNPRYLDFLVRVPNFAKEATRYSKGVWSSRLRLYPEEFFLIQMPVPPLEEQQEIVDYLDGEISKIDRLSQATQSSIVLLSERRTALISAAVTGQIEIPEVSCN